jgi:UPF0755 protein
MKNINNSTNRYVKWLLIFFVVVAIYIGNVVFFPVKIPNNNYQLIVDKSQNLSMLATNLESQGIIKSKTVFIWLLKVLHKDRKVVAGLYILKNSLSTWGVISRITNGHPDQISVTIIDGWNIGQLRAYVNGLANIKHISINMSNDELKTILKIHEPNIEGLFYPSTYFISPNQTDLEIYSHAHKLMQDKLATLFKDRSIQSVYASPYQLLIMASLIQKETSKLEDMYLVSTVFNNRLKRGMKLQNDPAVFYGLKNRAKIVRADFQIDTVYNTYLRSGLPPTPICIPSLNALKAASTPLDKPELLYFIAVGNGKTKFSNKYDEHVTLIHKYLKKNNLQKPKTGTDIQKLKAEANLQESKKIVAKAKVKKRKTHG